MRKLILLASLATLACGGDDSTSPVDGGSDFTVSVVNTAFNPGNISVPAGSVVNWQWNSSGTAHNVTFDDGAPGSDNLTTGSFARTFTAPGNYTYHCSLHLPNMTGVVSVTAGTTGGSGGGGGGGSYP